eukprot:Skav235286  [mRNA]  locus=scaffold874:569327:570868:+ [translate_table: standard]
MSCASVSSSLEIPECSNTSTNAAVAETSVSSDSLTDAFAPLVIINTIFSSRAASSAAAFCLFFSSSSANKACLALSS